MIYLQFIVPGEKNILSTVWQPFWGGGNSPHHKMPGINTFRGTLTPRIPLKNLQDGKVIITAPD